MRAHAAARRRAEPSSPRVVLARGVLLFGRMREHARTHQREARRSQARIDRPSATPPRLVDTDPEDPSQELDDVGTIRVGPMAVDAQPSAEAADDVAMAAALSGDGGDLAALDAEGDAIDDGTVPASDEAEAQGGEQDTGDLYGVRTPHAGDPDLADGRTPDGFEGSEEGESFMEALSVHAAEGGPAPEEEVVVIDDSDPDRGHSPTESGDRPVADKGSGGPGGL